MYPRCGSFIIYEGASVLYPNILEEGGRGRGERKGRKAKGKGKDTHFEPAHGLQIAHGAHEHGPRVEERGLQELLDRDVFSRAGVPEEELRREGRAGPEACAVGWCVSVSVGGAFGKRTGKGKDGRRKGEVGRERDKRGGTHAIVAAASFWYPHGQSPRSASVCPPPHTPRSHAAPLSSSGVTFSLSVSASPALSPTSCRLKPTNSSVHAGAPEPPE
jgi:hypothetical protein